jgi:hypothetical protein
MQNFFNAKISAGYMVSILLDQFSCIDPQCTLLVSDYCYIKAVITECKNTSHIDVTDNFIIPLSKSAIA